MFFFREITDEVTTFSVISRQHIKQERFHVIVQSFVIEKEFGKQAQILTIQFVDVTVHLEDGQISTSVDFSARRMTPTALVLMP